MFCIRKQLWHFPSKLTGDRLRTNVAMYQWQEAADGLGHAGEGNSSALDALYNIILDGPRDFESLVAEMEQQGFNSQDASDALKEWAGVYLIMEVTGGGGGEEGVVRFLNVKEAREAMEEEFGQPAPQDIRDILVTSRPTPPA